MEEDGLLNQDCGNQEVLKLGLAVIEFATSSHFHSESPLVQHLFNLCAPGIETQVP